jgi:16S rRNA (guanine966-N2)-methyltransferase
MRIISGDQKGRKLEAPQNLPVRPTTDRAKEALFNIIENRYNLNDKEILDIFSGTGNISFEFSSRYSTSVTSVDHNIKCIDFIQKISDEYNFKIKTIQSDATKFLEETDLKFHLIFADPPYNYPKYQELKNLILDKKLIHKNGCLIIEHDKNTIFHEENMELRKYGNVNFSIFSL